MIYVSIQDMAANLLTISLSKAKHYHYVGLLGLDQHHYLKQGVVIPS